MSKLYVTLTNDEMQDFSTGSHRDSSKGKPRYDLISSHALKRWALLMARGAEKSGARNWELGQPASRYYESAYRHLMQFSLKDEPLEDHLSAVLFNIGAIIDLQERVELGELPASLLDFPLSRETTKTD